MSSKYVCVVYISKHPPPPPHTHDPDPLAEDGRLWIRGRAVTTLVGRLAFAPVVDENE